jgi:DNA polymerase-3 subunit beta
MIDVLSVLEETGVELLFKDELSPAIMRPAYADGFLSVVMPMRL